MTKRASDPPATGPKCPECDPSRHVERADGTVIRCPNCHPLSAQSLTALVDKRDWLQAELERVEVQIAEWEAAAMPDWADRAAGVD